jgi:O-antigen ligase
VLPVFVGYALYDLYRLARRENAAGFLHRHWREAAAALLAALVGAAFLAQPIARRIAATHQEIAAYSSDPVGKTDGMSIRFVLWSRALAVISDSPLLGGGGAESMRRIKEGIPGQPALYEREIHSHNLFLDELRTRGLAGLALHLFFFGALFASIWRRASAELRWNAVFFLFSMVIYGSMHGLLQTERNIALIALYFGIVLSALGKPWLARHYRRSSRSP